LEDVPPDEPPWLDPEAVPPEEEGYHLGSQSLVIPRRNPVGWTFCPPLLGLLPDDELGVDETGIVVFVGSR
jgi:hypothetical protein